MRRDPPRPAYHRRDSRDREDYRSYHHSSRSHYSSAYHRRGPPPSESRYSRGGHHSSTTERRPHQEERAPKTERPERQEAAQRRTGQDRTLERREICPLLMRVSRAQLQTFVTVGESMSLTNFSREASVPGEVRLYCWLDANLREVVDLLKESVGALREGNISVTLYSVYQAPDGKFVRKRLGGLESYRRGKDDFLELRAHSFKAGDFLNLVVQERRATKEEAKEDKERVEEKEKREKSVDRKEKKSETVEAAGETRENEKQINQS